MLGNSFRVAKANEETNGTRITLDGGFGPAILNSPVNKVQGVGRQYGSIVIEAEEGLLCGRG